MTVDKSLLAGSTTMLVLKLLDVGVQGLIVPNVKTLDQVRSLVDYAK